MGRKRWWFLGALAAGAAVFLARFLAIRPRWVWMRHRRGEGPPPGAEQEIAPQPGDILLFHHVARLRDLLITMVTHSPFYHAALYAGDGHVVEARPHGVRRNDLRGREHNFVVIPAAEGKGAAALRWAEGEIGDPFDRLDLLVIFLEHLFTHWHINYAPFNKYTCAELVATAYDHAGVRLIPGKDLDEVAPADLACQLPQPRL